MILSEVQLLGVMFVFMCIMLANQVFMLYRISKVAERVTRLDKLFEEDELPEHHPFRRTYSREVSLSN